MTTLNGRTEILHDDGTIEIITDCSRIRIPQTARVSEDELREAIDDEEVLTAIFGKEALQSAKDVDLAHKVVDPAKVSGLTNSERSRLFSLLAKGGEWQGKTSNEKSEAVRDLILALELEHVTGAKRHRLIRERTGKYGAHCKKVNDKTGKKASVTNINKYDDLLKAMLLRVADYDRQDLKFILDLAIKGGYKLSLEGITRNLESTQRLLEAFPSAFEKYIAKRDDHKTDR